VKKFLPAPCLGCDWSSKKYLHYYFNMLTFLWVVSPVF